MSSSVLNKFRTPCLKPKLKVQFSRIVQTGQSALLIKYTSVFLQLNSKIKLK